VVPARPAKSLTAACGMRARGYQIAKRGLPKKSRLVPRRPEPRPHSLSAAAITFIAGTLWIGKPGSHVTENHGCRWFDSAPLDATKSALH
jgi:hypothetical protein